jgi:hypothetical protein
MAERELTSILRTRGTPTEREKPQTLSEEFGLSPELAEEISGISSKQRVNILADQPAIKDALGFEPLVRTLSDVILSDSTQTPMTICIDSGWGAGKTSILRMLEAQAKMLDFPCIWLNAWSLESTDNMFLAVASEILGEFESTEKPERTRKGLIDSLSDWLTNAAIALSGSSTASILSGAVEQMKGARGVARASLEREQKISELASVATTHRSFERLVDTLFEHSRYRNARLVVFIDDLDRALPDQIATILRNLKLILETPRCVFVLAMDMDVVARAIGDHYRRQNANLSLVNLGEVGGESSVHITQAGPEGIGEEFGYHYLEKLIQISAEVPRLTRESVNRYLRGIGIAPEVLEIIRWAPDEEVLNPRRLKRYINWLSVSLQLILSVPMPSEVRNVTALRAMALRHDYPEVYSLLIDISSKTQRGLETVSSYDQISDHIQRTFYDKVFVEFKKPVFVFNEDELRKASSALGTEYESLRDETNELLRRITYLMMVGRSPEAPKIALDRLGQEIPCLEGNRLFRRFLFEDLLESDEDFVDLARRLAESQSIKEETSEFLQYLSKLPGRELLVFDRFRRRTPVLDVGRREYWISREETRDRYVAQRLKQIIQAGSGSDRSSE